MRDFTRQEKAALDRHITADREERWMDAQFEEVELYGEPGQGESRFVDPDEEYDVVAEDLAEAWQAQFDDDPSPYRTSSSPTGSTN